MDVDDLLKSIFDKDIALDITLLFEEKLERYQLSKTKALKLLGVDKDVFDEIVNGKAKQPNLIHVVKIAEFLETAIADFVQIVLRNQNQENITSIHKARKVTFLMKNFDVKQLTKLGFFKENEDIDALIGRVLQFFGYDSIAEFESELTTPMYSRSKNLFSDKMKDFWVKSAYQTFKVVNNPNPYDRNKLKDLIVKMKPYSQDVGNGLLIVCKALYHLGITVICQNYLPTTHVRGATFIINQKPCIVLTDYKKNYATLWFTLMHELHHVLFDYDLIKTNSYHLTGDDDLFLIEEKADAFAREFFLSAEKFHYIKMYINNPYVVSQFAKENEIHVALVYSFFTWYQENLYQKNYHGAFKNFYPSSQDALKKLHPITWKEENMIVVREKIKTVFELK